MVQQVRVTRDPAVLQQTLTTWLKDRVAEAGARGCVVGLSGGVDSAVVAALCRRAFPGATLAAVMPCHSQPEDVADARLVAGTLGLPVVEVDLGPVYDAFLVALGSAAVPPQLTAPEDEERTRLARANLKPRLRMMTLYALANRLSYLVVGTGNRSELAVGYFTKYGDGGVDLLPLGGLVKQEVRALASHLGLPERIVNRVPSAGLWVGQTDEGELGLSYEALDRYLLTGRAEPEAAERIRRLAALSEHKRRMPPVADV